MNSKEAKMVSEAVQFVEGLGVPAIALVADIESEVPNDASSSIGGSPSMPFGADWPKCNEGHPMVFLAQINFAEMPPLQSFPASGVLQFFVKDEDVFGLFDEVFQVIFHADITGLARRKAPIVKNTPFGARLHSEGATLRGLPAVGQPSFGCWQVEEYEEKLEAQGATDDVYDALDDIFFKARPSVHYIGGHPCFDQGDVRGEDGRDMTSVLLQLGYQLDENGWEVCWGDAGQATFLARESDLRKRDFSNVLYNWDCA